MAAHANAFKRARFSRESFSPIPDPPPASMGPHDATIDIPLERVPASGGGPGLPSQASSSALRPEQFVRGRRVKTPPAGPGAKHVGYDGEEDTVNAMGRLYQKILNFSVIARYLLYVAPLALCIVVPIIVGATRARGARLGGVRIVWFFSWVEVVWVSLWVSKLVAHFLPFVFQIFAGIVSSGVRKYSTVIQALEIPLSLVGWAVCSLATFMPIMTRNPTQRAEKDTGAKEWETIVQRILGAAVCSSLVFLVEKAIIQLISIDYHRKQFNFRIVDSKHNIYLLSLLYEASRTLFPAFCNEFAEEDFIISDQLNLKSLGLHNRDRAHYRPVSAAPTRLFQDIERYRGKLTSAVGNVAHEITGREMFNSNSAHSIVIEALEKKHTSEALAKRIWMSFVTEGRDALYQEDIMEVLGPDRKDAAEEAFAAIDQDGNGDISLDEMILTVTEFGRERKAISTSMHDVDQAINVLDNLFSAVVYIAIIFIFIAFLNKSFVTTLATAGTALLSLSFVFSASCQEVLGSCIFVFVKHPFDVGDRVDLGPDQFLVEHISLLFSVFKRSSGANCGRIVQIPNIVLNTLWIENISRSKAMSEQLEIDVSFNTTFDDIQILKNELQNFVQDKDNSRDFYPDVEVSILGTTDQSKLMLQVEIRHKSNWANEAIRQARRSKFMCALVSALKVVPIYPPGFGDAAGSAANPNYAVTITDAEAKKNQADAAAAREQQRLIPVNKIEEAKNAVTPNLGSRSGAAPPSKRDDRVIDDLSSRGLASDPARDEKWNLRDDSSTLRERPSIDRQDMDDTRGLLHSESKQGKRKPSEAPSRLQPVTVPTIREPQSTSFANYGQPAPSGYEDLQSGHSSSSPPKYGPGRGNQQTGAQAPLPQVPPSSSPIQMSQVGRSPSNPYRRNQPPNELAGPSEDEEVQEGFGRLRPYSGV